MTTDLTAELCKSGIINLIHTLKEFRLLEKKLICLSAHDNHSHELLAVLFYFASFAFAHSSADIQLKKNSHLLLIYFMQSTGSNTKKIDRPKFQQTKVIFLRVSF